jgi:hypothetical protein
MTFRRHPHRCGGRCGKVVERFGERCAACLELEDWRKVLAFASSAGDTISEREALEAIRAIARRRIGRPEAVAIEALLEAANGRGVA